MRYVTQIYERDLRTLYYMGWWLAGTLATVLHCILTVSRCKIPLLYVILRPYATSPLSVYRINIFLPWVALSLWTPRLYTRRMRTS